MTRNPFYFCFCVFFLIVAADASACRQTAVQRSKSMIETVLNDVVKTYRVPSDDGINAVRLVATDVNKVSISQEEKADEITYDLSVETNCKVGILKCTSSTTSVVR